MTLDGLCMEFPSFLGIIKLFINVTDQMDLVKEHLISFSDSAKLLYSDSLLQLPISNCPATVVNHLLFTTGLKRNDSPLQATAAFAININDSFCAK